jgi:hypothetical protein
MRDIGLDRPWSLHFFTAIAVFTLGWPGLAAAGLLLVMLGRQFCTAPHPGLTGDLMAPNEQQAAILILYSKMVA